MDIYREEILEHWQNPQNFGEMKKPDFVIEQVNPLCGDEVTFYFRLSPSVSSWSGNLPAGRQDDHDRISDLDSIAHAARSRMTKKDSRVIEDVRFTGSGCAISIASASMLSEAIKGKSVSQLNKITGQDVLGLIGGNVAPARLKCAFLALEAIRKLQVKSEKLPLKIY